MLDSNSEYKEKKPWLSLSRVNQFVLDLPRYSSPAIKLIERNEPWTIKPSDDVYPIFLKKSNFTQFYLDSLDVPLVTVLSSFIPVKSGLCILFCFSKCHGGYSVLLDDIAKLYEEQISSLSKGEPYDEIFIEAANVLRARLTFLERMDLLSSLFSDMRGDLVDSAMKDGFNL